MRWVRATAVLAFALTLVTRAGATEDADRKRALELFKESKQLYQEGRFRDAIERLEQAYALAPEPVLLYNLGRAFESSGELERAIDAYRRYLDEEPNAPDRGAISARIDTLERQLKERQALERQREAQSKQPPTTPVREPAPAEPEPEPASIWPWLTVGAGAVVLTSGAVLGIVAQNQREAADDERTAKAAKEGFSDAQRTASWANVAFVAGGVLVVGGVSWALIEGANRSPAHARLRLAVSPAGARLEGSFR